MRAHTRGVQVDADGRALLPVACTLNPYDGAQRLSEWRRLASEAGLGTEMLPGQLRLRFANTPDVGVELARLVDAERECCAFLGWTLDSGDGEWRVTITGTDDDLRTVLLVDV